MKSFKDYIKPTEADVARQFMNLHTQKKKGPLNSFDQAKYNIMRDKMSDPMIAHRQKIDAKRLPPTRSGSKGGDGGGGNDQ
jgi:hypothetical protein